MGIEHERGRSSPWATPLLALLLLALVHPLSWPGQPAPLWFPSSGLGLALIAWFGLRAALLLLAAVLLAAVRGALWPAVVPPGEWPGLLAAAAYEGAFQVAMLAAAWRAFRRAGGQPDLRDPWSAVLFLLVPGAVLGLFALLRALPVWLAGGDFSLPREAATYWVGQALGVFALTPPLLVLLGQWGVGGEWGAKDLFLRSPLPTPHPPRLADWLEVAALGVGTALIGVLIILTQAPRQPGGWQLWGAPLLLVVWAGMRQGLSGATLAAAAGAAAAAEVLGRLDLAPPAPLLVQANLLAQCATALLVASSAGWVRHSEARYRQVVSQIPVVLYSARLLAPFRPGQPPRAEVHFVSPPSPAILGCPPEALLGDYEHWLARVHPDDRELLRAALLQLGRQSEPVVCEYRLAAPPFDPPASDLARSAPPSSRGGGPHRQRWLRDTLVPHHDPEGRLEGWEGIVSDITEQRVLADDLRRTTSMFHALVSNMPAGVFFVSARSGRPILVNQRARQLLGQREDFSANLEHVSTLYRLHRADGTPYPVDELPVSQAMRRGAPCMRDDIVVHRPDGRRVPLITWAAPLELSQSGRTDAVVWVLEDLTALRQAEAARRETEGRLRTVIESLAEGLLVQDRQGAVVDGNTAARALLGWNGAAPGPDEGGDPTGRSSLVLGASWLREDGSPLPGEEHPVRRALRDGAPVRNVVLGIAAVRADREPRAPGAGGEGDPASPPCLAPKVRWVLVNSLPLAAVPAGGRARPGAGGGDAGGPAPAGVVTTLADITDHVHAQQQLRASEERYRGLVDSLPLMVFQVDGQMRLNFVNPATTALTGYGLDEVREPDAWQKLIHPDDLPALLAAVRAAGAGRAVRAEVRYRARDGQERVGYCLLQPSPQAVVSGQWSVVREERGASSLTTDHSPLTPAAEGVTALVLDMTRERRLEQELHRAQRLELVGRLSSGIAHDFNNLLAVLLGLCELARQGLPTEHPVQQDLLRAGEVGEQAVNLARQVLAFAKQSKVAFRPVEVNRAVGRALNILRTLLPRDVEVEGPLDGAELFVHADEMQLQQVLMNLCLNARDAMPTGGRLRIRTEAVASGQWLVASEETDGSSLATSHWPLAPAQRWLRLSVEDSGHGMTEEVRRRIFEPFFTTRERGTGLGLAVVYQIVTSFGGRVEVRSEPGRGTCFDVWLPLTSGGGGGI